MLKTDVWKPATTISHGQYKIFIFQGFYLLINISFKFTVLEAIAELLENPNPDDALVASIAEVYNTNRAKFTKTAKEYVKKVLISVSNSIIDSFVTYLITNSLLFRIL